MPVTSRRIAPADFTRFEIAVALRLVEALQNELQETGTEWLVERALILPGRRELVAFVHEAGIALRVYYNQSVLPAGPADAGGRHYLGNTGRLRPDLTITLHANDFLVGAAVVEAKLSDDTEYILGGYQEAMLYRWEYSQHLFPWPKALVVASGPVPGGVRESDDVVACTWNAWPPPTAVKAIVKHAAGLTEEPAFRARTK